jgi:hypothetical protein
VPDPDDGLTDTGAGAEGVDDDVCSVMTPPVATAVIELAPGETATGAVTVTADVTKLAFEAMVIETTATTPSPMAVVFTPYAKHVSEPLPDPQLTALPAAAAAAPVVTWTEEMSADV